jgi:uncharacterized protein (TIGR03437 family)
MMALFALSRITLAADFAPSVQWVRAIGGSGSTLVTAAAADSKGNLYVVGNTTSLDFPTTGATQPKPGGSTLVRVNLTDTSAARVYAPELLPVTFATADPRNPGTIFASSGDKLWRSADGGSTWSLISQFPAGALTSAMAVDPEDSQVIYAGSYTAGAFKSVDGGLHWTEINDGIPQIADGSRAVTMIWIDPSSPNVIFAAAATGLARSTDGGATWRLAGSVNAPGALVFDPFSRGVVYIGGGPFLARSADGGQTFTPLGRLPDDSLVTALVPDPRQKDVLFAASPAGVYRSLDAGATWTLRYSQPIFGLVADPVSSALYANSPGRGIVRSVDGFATVAPVGPGQPDVRQLLLSGPSLLAFSAPTADVFAVKLDNTGNVVYSTYLGGSGSDSAAALAVGADGSLYVAGSTTSVDFPVTAGVYQPVFPAGNGETASYLLKLNAEGALAWSTYFTGPQSTVGSLAVDSAGQPFIGGATAGRHPTTSGAYQTDFQQAQTCTGLVGCIGGTTSAFVSKFDDKGTGLIYSTYVSTDGSNHAASTAPALAVDSAGNTWIGVAVNPSSIPLGGIAANVIELNSTGSAVIASAAQPGLGNVAALALDGSSNVTVAGSWTPAAGRFPASPDAFQSTPRPLTPVLPSQPPPGGGMDAFVARFDAGLTHLTAATLLGGELPDAASGIAIDSSGAVIVSGYTDSAAFPTHGPFQSSFSPRAGFVAGFDSSLSKLVFSTYLGDGRPFAAQAAAPDGDGGILVAGSTLAPGNLFVGGDNGASFSVGSLAVANRIALAPAPPVRLDSVANFASRLATPLAPGEPILANGAGFGVGAQILLDGLPLPAMSSTDTSILAIVPETATLADTAKLQVSNGGSLSNAMVVPTAPAAPAIYSLDGSGAGQGYILNSDGTVNSASNPAAPGSAVTLFIAGAGPYTVSDGFAVAAQQPSVFIDGFYCDGIAATVSQVNGLPGNVYRLSVYVPDPAKLVTGNPDLRDFQFPPRSPIQVVMGSTNPLNFANSAMVSQSGIFIDIASAR